MVILTRLKRDTDIDMRYDHRIRWGEPGLPILPGIMIMVPSAMEQKLDRVGSLPNGARKLTEKLRATSMVPCVAPHYTLQTCNAAHMQLATSECVASKTGVNPIFCPWLYKYGGKPGFSLSNSVGMIQLCPHRCTVEYQHIFIFS